VRDGLVYAVAAASAIWVGTRAVALMLERTGTARRIRRLILRRALEYIKSAEGKAAFRREARRQAEDLADAVLYLAQNPPRFSSRESEDGAVASK
jgi:hypothetical protein